MYTIINESAQCLARILADDPLAFLSNTQKTQFTARLNTEFPRLFNLLRDIYPDRYDLYYHLSKLVSELAHAFNARPAHLKKRDATRQTHTTWFQSEEMVGMAVYVDLVAGDLKQLKDNIPYYQSLGITYLHLMPLYLCPEGDSDGGYAVSDYRQVSPDLGTMKDLENLAKALHKAGINLVLDFVFNHTSDEHQWAKLAKSGDPEYQGYYYLFNDRHEPDEYDQTLREIFPSVRRGCFSLNKDMDKWVWTTFNNFQWDLNYRNPSVFRAMVDEMLFLANAGCDLLRLDALAFVWKEKWTTSENLPHAHQLIQAFNACLRIVAPAVAFKSEAIVHPDEVIKYIDQDECQTSYNPLLMALMWNSLATRKTRLLQKSLSHRFRIANDCSWVNYARCHDDIGWTFDDQDASEIGINGYDHRLFLNQFFTGKFDGSYATGVGFQFNPDNGDCRVCGSMASLCGVEQALDRQDAGLLKLALDRVNLLHSIIMSIGGIPLLYQGDELGLLNDYSYQEDETKQHDARWVNRPRVTADDIAQLQDGSSIASRVNGFLQHIIALRKSMPVLGAGVTDIHYLPHDHLFAYSRSNNQGDEVHCVVNFSDQPQSIETQHLSFFTQAPFKELLSKKTLSGQHKLHLAPYEVLWLTPLANAN